VQNGVKEMLKKMFLMIIISLGITGISTVYAHSVLMDANPRDGEIITESLFTVTLNFNTKIEKGSNFYVENQSGEKLTPNNIQLDENSLLGNFNQSIPNGNYTLYWAVIGSDGHQITGDYPFEVQVAEPPEIKEKSGEEIHAQDSTEEKEINKSVEDSNQQVNSSDVENTKDSINWLVIATIILILAILAWVVLVVKRTSKGR
jgi:copper resistance protein C